MSLFIPSAIYLFVKNRKIFPSLIAISKLYALNCTWTDSKRHFNVYFSAPRSKHVYLDGANYQKWLTIAIALAHGWNPESLCKYAPLPTQVAATSLVLHLFSYSLAHTLLQKWILFSTRTLPRPPIIRPRDRHAEQNLWPPLQEVVGQRRPDVLHYNYLPFVFRNRFPNQTCGCSHGVRVEMENTRSIIKMGNDVSIKYPTTISV